MATMIANRAWIRSELERGNRIRFERHDGTGAGFFALSDGMILVTYTDGWSAGVTETVCSLDRPAFFFGMLDDCELWLCPNGTAFPVIFCDN